MTRRGLALAGALAVLSGAGLLAATLAGPVLGQAHPLAVATRTVLSGTCHQRSERSLALHGVSLGACARCTGLHASGLAGGALLLLLPATAAARLPRARRLVALGIAPLLLDVAAGGIWSSWDHPWLRAATGLFAGCTLLLSLLSTDP